MGKNKKPMLTVLVEEEKLQRFRDYAAGQDMSMGAIVNQLIDGLLGGKSSVESIESRTNIDKSVEDIIDSSIAYNNRIIELLIVKSIEKQQKAIEVLINKSIEGNNKSLEELIAVSIDSRLETLPPPLSLLDVDRLIGSAVGDLKNIIGNQGAEIDRLSKIVGELMTSNNPKPPTTTAPQPLSSPLAWGAFCPVIGEPLPKDRTKASADKMTALALNKGFGEWIYDGKNKKFSRKSEK